MKALCWQGKNDVRVQEVPAPHVINPHDAIVDVTLSAICGSDLHLYDGYVMTLKEGDILGHEFMGIVVDAGSEVKTVKPGDRVVASFTISCGQCFFCTRQMWSLCDNSNPNAGMVEKLYGYSPAGFYGYSHLFGGYAGGQAEYVRVPYADNGLLKLSNGVPDEQALFLGDVLSTGYMAAENCAISPGDTVAVWGCGPVGLFAIKSAYLLGAERVIAIDRVPERLRMAREQCNAEVLDYTAVEVDEALSTMTGGRGPDACIDAVGMEAHGTGIDAWYDRAKQAVRLETDRPTALRQAIKACRKGGTLSVPGVYSGFVDKMPMGAVFNKGLTVKTGQTHVQKYMRPLLEHIEQGRIDPSFIITHRMRLDDAPRGYDIFKRKEDNCIKIVLTP